MITPDQIRAARALKNWSQGDLAQRTGLAVPTIANIELGKQVPGQKTMEAIIDACEVGGIAFTKKGVEHTDNSVTFLIGKNKYHNVLRDALNLLNSGQEYLLLGCDDKRSPPDVVSLTEELFQKGIVRKCLIKEGNIFIQGLANNSRQIPDQYFTFGDVTAIYLDKIATVIPATDTENEKTMIVKSQQLADDYRKIFQFMWDHASPMKRYKNIKDYKHPMLTFYSDLDIKKLSEK